MSVIALKLGHLCFEIGTLKRSLTFWEPLFQATGFKKIMGSDDFVGFSNGAFELFLCRSKPRRVRRPPPSGKEMVISDHVAFRVSERREVDAIVGAMGQAGVTPLFPPEEHPEFTPGYYAASFCDPDNNVIELYCVPTRA